MTKERQRKYKGIVIGLIFGLLMTGIMSFNVFADEAESPPDAVLAGESTEDALSGEDALTSPEALAEGLSEEMKLRQRPKQRRRQALRLRQPG